MNQHLHSPTKLTEFARDFEEEPETLFGRFVNKIQNAYNASYNSVNEIPSSSTNCTGVNNIITKSMSQCTFYGDPSNNISRESSSSSINSAKPHLPPLVHVNPNSDKSTTPGTDDSKKETIKVCLIEFMIFILTAY